jgi:V8-like Glu-specific endopeptidase
MIAFGACTSRTDEPSSSVKIDSGWFVGNGGDGDHTIPAVMYLGNCTSTAVSDNTLVTAGHCVDHGADADGRLAQSICIRSGSMALDKCSEAVYIQQAWDESEAFRYDVAVAIFPRGTFTRYFEVNDATTRVGDPFMLVGYSQANLPGGAEHSKRWGYNRIAGFDEQTVIVSTYAGSQRAVAVSPGDSGGPLFSKSCKLTGVASRMAEGGIKQSLHTNLTDPENRAWLKSLRAKGAEFCGLSGARAEHCAAEGRAAPRETSTAASGQDAFPCTESSSKGGGSEGDGGKAVPGAVYLALDAKDRLHVSVPGNAAKVLVCADKDLDQCEADELETSFEKRLGKRRVYEIAAPLADDVSQIVVVARTASGDDVARLAAQLQSN